MRELLRSFGRYALGAAVAASTILTIVAANWPDD